MLYTLRLLVIKPQMVCAITIHIWMFCTGPPYHPYKIKVLNHMLKSLLACEEAQLPPANFSGLLAPLLVHSECPWPWPYIVLALIFVRRD